MIAKAEKKFLKSRVVQLSGKTFPAKRARDLSGARRRELGRKIGHQARTQIVGGGDTGDDIYIGFFSRLLGLLQLQCGYRFVFISFELNSFSFDFWLVVYRRPLSTVWP